MVKKRKSQPHIREGFGAASNSPVFEFEVYDGPSSEVMHPPACGPLIEEGRQYVAEKRYGEAERSYRQALALMPESPVLLHGLANALMGQKQFDPAQAIFMDLTVRFPDYVYGWTGLSSLHLNEGRLGPAEEALKNAMRQKRVPSPAFAVFCDLGARLSILQRNPLGVAAWFDLLKKICPTHRLTREWETRLSRMPLSLV